MSNFFRGRDPNQHGIVCRPVQRPEIESGLRLILANDEGLAGDEAVLDFLSFAMQRKIDLNQMWLAQLGEQIAWALLPIPSPGRTMLMFTPTRIPHATPLDAITLLTERVCAHWQSRDMHLAQFLLEPADQTVTGVYVSCGFEVLAELLYLHRTVHEPVAEAVLPAGFALTGYSTVTHDSFAETILKSYEGSLDCPALNGRRSIDDVLSGHKGTGIFDPGLWHLLTENGQPRGVLILSPSQNNDSIELVYLGLTPEARGRGLGNAMMNVALASVVKKERSELSLAVDSRNLPALKLYYRHGLRRVGSRVALLKDLRVVSRPGSTKTSLLK